MRRPFFLAALLALFVPQTVFARISTEDVLQIGERFESKSFAYAKEEGAVLEPTADGRSFTLWWQPSGFDPAKDTVFVSLHGHQGWAPKDFMIWHPHIAPRGYAFLGVQWWCGRSAESVGYAKPKDIYPWIVAQLEKRGIPRKHVIFTGFSMGGANSYAVAYLDRLKDPYFALVISNAGAMEKDFPPNRPFLDAAPGEKPFAGTPWILYCSEHDEQRPNSCELMEFTEEKLEELGASVEMFVKDPVGGHGGFMKKTVHGPALDLADRIVKEAKS